jgi:hypothetical protein
LKEIAMRFSSSKYDAFRQPGVFKELERMASLDTNVMKKQLLAQLRFDDLLSNDSDDGLPATIVVSLSDVLDGRLFTLLEPADLEGISLQILCSKSVAQHDQPILQTLRNWLHDKNGNGVQASFLAAPDGLTRFDIGEAIAKMQYLSVNSLDEARNVIRTAGFSKDHADQLREHWRRWTWAFKDNMFTLTPFPGTAASAVGPLRQLVEEDELSLFNIDEDGTRFFKCALKHLEHRGGKRDSMAVYLQKLLATTKGEKREQVVRVNALVCHHTFKAIAHGNEANAEFSTRLGPDDDTAFSDEMHSLEKLELPEVPTQKTFLDGRIIGGLGGLDAREYQDVRKRIVPDIISGIKQFRESQSTDKLNRAFEKLAPRVNKEPYWLGKKTDEACRTIIFPTVVRPLLCSMAGYAFKIVLTGGAIAPGTCLGAEAVIVGVGTAAAALSGTVFGKLAGERHRGRSNTLLTRSLLSAAANKLTALERNAGAKQEIRLK